MPKTQTTYRIAKVATTSDTLTRRAGLALFVRYLSQIQLSPLLDEAFGSLRKSRKGLPHTAVILAAVVVDRRLNNTVAHIGEGW